MGLFVKFNQEVLKKNRGPVKAMGPLYKPGLQ